MNATSANSQTSTIRADLHAHTTASDGSLSPSELVAAAAEREITHLAVTDHDTVAGYAESKAAGLEHGLEIICGVEMTVSVGAQVVHMLGLGVDPENARLLEFTAEVVELRRQRYCAMIERLRKHGLNLPDNDELLPERAESLTRPRLAGDLVRFGFCESVDDAFKRYLGRKGPGYVEHQVPPAETALEVIHGAGGVSSLAHCGLYWEGERLAEELLDRGLMAIEVHHPDHDFMRRERLSKMVYRRGALLTGGGDFHTFDSPKSIYFGKSYTNDNDFRRLEMTWQSMRQSA